jgi:hypothetical protein
MERTEDNKFTVKEEKVNVEELTIDTNIFIEVTYNLSMNLY